MEEEGRHGQAVCDEDGQVRGGVQSEKYHYYHFPKEAKEHLWSLVDIAVLQSCKIKINLSEKLWQLRMPNIVDQNIVSKSLK